MPEILAVDVHYHPTVAIAAGVLFSNWEALEADSENICHIQAPAEYVPGQFYKRELPCVLELLKTVESIPDVIVIDGYVDLGLERTAGLGRHLWQALDEESVVIGVAKSKFQGTPAVTQLLRGQSKSPLYITAAGIDLEYAKRHIASMAGPYRIPTLLKRADQLCRGPV